MKSGKGLDEVKAVLAKKGFRGYAVENCGLPNEHVYTNLDEIPDESGYFLLVIARK
jgi:precorrin-2/cobalt-factor-2 C20-methyltransferase